MQKKRNAIKCKNAKIENIAKKMQKGYKYQIC